MFEVTANTPFILLVSTVFSLLIMILFYITANGLWFCIFGIHKYVYAGQKHGMMVHKEQGIVGTQRNMYKCARCEKNKPIENKDYV